MVTFIPQSGAASREEWLARDLGRCRFSPVHRILRRFVIRVVVLAACPLISWGEEKPVRTDDEIVYVLLNSADQWEVTGAIYEAVERPESAAIWGPPLLALIDREGADLGSSRAAAVIALGMLDYQPAVSRLSELLGDERNWRFAFAAARSLARLKDPSARPALLKANREHWYWAVRYATREALLLLDGDQTALSNPFRFSWDDPVKRDRIQLSEEADQLVVLMSDWPKPAEESEPDTKWEEAFLMAEKKAGRIESLRDAFLAELLGYGPPGLRELTGEYGGCALWLNSWLLPAPRGERFFFNRWVLPDCGKIGRAHV